jgi:hypothetical protein
VLVDKILAKLKKHPKFQLKLNSRVTRVTRFTGNVTATFFDQEMKRDDSVSGTAIIYLFFLQLKSHPKHQQLCLVYASDNKLFKNSMTTLGGQGY